MSLRVYICKSSVLRTEASSSQFSEIRALYPSQNGCHSSPWGCLSPPWCSLSLHSAWWLCCLAGTLSSFFSKQHPLVLRNVVIGIVWLEEQFLKLKSRLHIFPHYIKKQQLLWKISWFYFGGWQTIDFFLNGLFFFFKGNKKIYYRDIFEWPWSRHMGTIL